MVTQTIYNRKHTHAKSTYIHAYYILTFHFTFFPFMYVVCVLSVDSIWVDVPQCQLLYVAGRDKTAVV